MEKSKKKKTLLICLVSVIAVLVLAGAVFGYFQVKKSQDIKESAAMYELGSRDLGEGNYQEAIAAFTKAIEIQPENAEYYVARGQAALHLEEESSLSAARADFEQAISSDETLTEAWIGLIDLSLLEGDYEKAEELLASAKEKAGDKEKPESKAEEIQKARGKYSYLQSLPADYEKVLQKCLLENDISVQVFSPLLTMIDINKDKKPEFIVERASDIVMYSEIFGPSAVGLVEVTPRGSALIASPAFDNEEYFINEAGNEVVSLSFLPYIETDNWEDYISGLTIHIEVLAKEGTDWNSKKSIEKAYKNNPYVPEYMVDDDNYTRIKEGVENYIAILKAEGVSVDKSYFFSGEKSADYLSEDSVDLLSVCNELIERYTEDDFEKSIEKCRKELMQFDMKKAVTEMLKRNDLL